MRWLIESWLSHGMDVHRGNFPRAWLMYPGVAFCVNCRLLGPFTKWCYFRLLAEESLRVLNPNFSYEMVHGILVSKKLTLYCPCYFDPEEETLCTKFVSKCVAMGSLCFPGMWGIHWVLELSLCLSVFGVARTLIFPAKQLQLLQKFISFSSNLGEKKKSPNKQVTMTSTKSYREQVLNETK